MISLDNLLEEEYQIWRKNVPYLYDLVYTQTLKWPSPCIQWFPDATREDNQTVQRLLTTTYTSGEESEHLLISQISFPDTVDEDALNNADIKFKITQSIPSDVDINRMRYCPLATNIIACRTAKPQILVYDYTKHSSSGSERGPDAILEGHTDWGFAIDWNPSKYGQLISGGRDFLVNLFDISAGLETTLRIHSGIVNDVCFSSSNSFIFASVSDDCCLAVTDLRNKESGLRLEKAHTSSIESCSFSPFRAELIATGSSDSSVKVWDTRHLECPLFTLRGHKGEVQTVKWSPHYESILGTGSRDRRVMIWDLNKADLESEMGSPELLFVHGGHKAAVEDFDWNPAEPMEIASTSSDNLFHVWKIPLEEYL